MTEQQQESLLERCLRGLPRAEQMRIRESLDRELSEDAYRDRREYLLRMIDNGGGRELLLPLIATTAWHGLRQRDIATPEGVLAELLGMPPDSRWDDVRDTLEAIAKEVQLK